MGQRSSYILQLVLFLFSMVVVVATDFYYEGSAEDLHMKSYCEKDNNGSLYMRLKWDFIKDAKYYHVFIVSNDFKKTLVFNTTKIEFNLDESMFKEKEEFYGYVIAYPRKNNSIALSDLQMGPLASCPKWGIWTEWSEWSPCFATECWTSGRRFTERICRPHDDDSDVMHPNHCQPIDTQSLLETCFYDCEEHKDFPGDKHKEVLDVASAGDDNDNISTKQMLILSAIFAAAMFCMAIMLVVWQRRSIRRKKNSYRTVSISTGLSVYVSYFGEKNKEKKLLNLVHHISTYGIQCVIDLLCQVEINSFGGIATWLPQQIHDVDKILIILTPAYLKALNASTQAADEDNEICKVMSEFHFIKSVMYHRFQNTLNVVVLLDGVKDEDVPEVFRDRVFCKFPKDFQNNNKLASQIIALLLGEEPLRTM